MNTWKFIKFLLADKLKEINQLIPAAEKAMEKAPEGSLILSHSRGKAQYYHKKDGQQGKGTYLSKENKKLIMALAQKGYEEIFLNTLKKQKNQIMRIMKTLPDVDPVEIYTHLPKGRKELVKSHVLTDEQYIEKWQRVRFVGKTFSADAPVILTERGERVRSKSEKILADKFYAMGIPYRYECPVKVKGYGIVYPDFTLLNVHKRKEYYFEHFGMMDNPEYCQKAILKLEDYAKNGIYPGKNLLLTFETLQSPLNMVVVERILKEFILSNEQEIVM